jgi:hypothetical protein
MIPACSGKFTHVPYLYVKIDKTIKMQACELQIQLLRQSLLLSFLLQFIVIT